MAGWDRDIRGLAQRVRQQGQNYGEQFQTELTRRAQLVAEKIQNDIASKSKNGVVPFTRKSIKFSVKKSRTHTYNNITVLPNQNKYLKWVLGSTENERKYIPYSSAPLSKEGNITGLRSRLKNGRYKVQQGRDGRKYIIDTKAGKRKSRMQRVIAVLERKRRKQLFDFYKQASRYTEMQLIGMKGSFRINYN